MKNIVEIKNLTKTYGKHRGVEDVSLTIFEGEIFGFIGPNGAGKSTTIRTMLGLIKAKKGSITIFGKDALAHPETITHDIGYLPSEVFYYDNMKVIDLLHYSASFYKKDCSQKIHELAEVLELDLHKKIDSLSYGNKKKVGIIQGLLHSPKLIILDEPTGGLDPLMQQRFFDLIAKENKQGATILFSSHILSEVQKMCNRVAIIKEGKIVQIADIKTLQEQNYKRVSFSVEEDQSHSIHSFQHCKDFKQLGHSISFLYNDNPNILIQTLSKMNLKNITIQEPSLEEIFMHYYQ